MEEEGQSIVEDEEHEEKGDLEFVEDEEVTQDPQEVEQKPQPELDTGGMLSPVDGKIGVDFARDGLIYSETLEQWTTHDGIDIFAREGQEVKAALSGRISEVYEDELWGKVIIMDHGNGLLTKYANLATIDMVKEGARIEKGAVISKVGITAAIEMIMEPHVHFEVIQDGKNMDPKGYIPAFSHLK
ncbi:MAG: M23 family metallopeptidase [Tissierellia bacterium]|nr:M23 family metallopeptidase [Tissierellia bacterium]